MDLSTLERAASAGLASVSKVELSALVDWCWDWGIATGDARFCVTWRVMREIDDWWDPEQGVPRRLFEDVDERVKRGLTDILGAPTPASGAQTAHDLGMELSLPRTVEQWRAGGWIDDP